MRKRVLVPRYVPCTGTLREQMVGMSWKGSERVTLPQGVGVRCQQPERLKRLERLDRLRGVSGAPR